MSLARPSLVLAPSGDASAIAGLVELRREFPSVSISAGWERSPARCARFTVAEWRGPIDDFSPLDNRVDSIPADEPLAVEVSGRAHEIGGVALEVLTRYQRRIGRRNAASADAAFSCVLVRHRSLYNRSNTVARVAFEHALDTWQWLLRLQPSADEGLQLAALLHDLDGLVLGVACSRLIEGTAVGATEGMRVARLLLSDTGVALETSERICELISEQVDVIRDAHALSGLSLAIPHIADVAGLAAASRAVARALADLRPATRSRLRAVRPRDDVLSLLDGELARLHDAVPPGPAAAPATRLRAS